MHKKALIIFVRNPELGKVKTRIAATVGDEKALAIYKSLLLHTKEVADKLLCTKFIFYADDINPDDLWNGYEKHLQVQNDLGVRMQQAFATVYAAGYQQVCIIGSDCYELTAPIIEMAFEALHHKDAAIGPARDGGYYLLGMKKLLPEVFENKGWSTATVYKRTIADFEEMGINYFILPELNDVDTVDDIPHHLLS